MARCVSRPSPSPSSLTTSTSCTLPATLPWPVLLTTLPGQSQFLTSPIVAKPLSFGDLKLNDPNYDGELTKGGPDSETRLMEMLAAQAAHSAGVVFEDEDAVASDEKRSTEER